MKSVFKVMALTAACLCLSSVAFGQWTLFTVDDDALPGGTSYPRWLEPLRPLRHILMARTRS